jgi:RND family efflux transporter MFP subunit
MSFRRPLSLGAFCLVALLLAIPLTGPGCSRKTQLREEKPPLPVRTVQLTATTESATVEALGTLRSGREAVLSGKVMGTIREVRKHAGESVRQGEIMIVIDSRDVDGQIAQARGALAQAKAAASLAETNLRRFQELHQRGAASQMELDQARYNSETAAGAVQQAEGAVATAASYRAYAEIPAPFSGRVVERLCEVGEVAAPGRPLLRIEDPSRIRLYASVDAARAAAAVLGAPATVGVPALGDRIFPGRLTELAPAADPSTHSIALTIDLDPDPALQAGLYARALLKGGERQVLRVPRAALVRRGAITGVFTIESGRTVYRMVSLSEGQPEAPEVLSGLFSGDAVVIDPPAGLEIGALAEVRP